MHHSALLAARRRQPFEPFRIVLTSGKWYDIRTAEGMVVTRVETAVTEDDELRTFDNIQVLELLPLSEVERVSPELG